MLYRISPLDNVEVELSTGHKRAAREIRAGENVIKYGYPIGHAPEGLPPGALVHPHRLKAHLSDKLP